MDYCKRRNLHYITTAGDSAALYEFFRYDRYQKHAPSLHKTRRWRDEEFSSLSRDYEGLCCDLMIFKFSTNTLIRLDVDRKSVV